ncbi:MULTISPECIES: hypothetical protein [Mesorhizobium]|uniref:hypothetical protein n=1 Tax=Mesorhizobium TaxID=68287 RepID=UPI0008019683|nr:MULTISPECIES: hypothetical protein [Mesorhizobium]MUT27293.1 hypothetical protein [Mesorhizobium japonicum]OBQ83755.1 hypothetical protein A9K71_23325 [Mesorhizobium sp. WSM3873]
MSSNEPHASDYEGKPHGPVALADTVVSITLGGKPCDVRNPTLRLDEHLDLQLQWTGSLKPGLGKIDQELIVTFEGGTVAEFAIVSHRYHVAGREDFTAVSRVVPLELGGKSKAIADAVILGGPSIHPKLGALDLQFDNMAASIRPFAHFQSIIGGGLRLPLTPTTSHRVELRTLDGRALKAGKLYVFLDHVCGFLGFIKGTRVGYGEVRNGARAGFRCLGFTKADRLEGVKNWYHWEIADKLPALFAGYTTAFESSGASRDLGRALTYYKIANLSCADAVETAMIMSAAALETVAGHVLGTAGGWTTSMLRNISLAEQIRACTRLLKIEGDPADQSARLQKRLEPKKGQQARDGFSLLTDFRNGVTHSTPFTYDLDIYDAWDASQWLLEVQLLALLGYRGKYQDRRLQRRTFAGNLATLPVAG